MYKWFENSQSSIEVARSARNPRVARAMAHSAVSALPLKGYEILYDQLAERARREHERNVGEAVEPSSINLEYYPSIGVQDSIYNLRRTYTCIRVALTDIGRFAGNGPSKTQDSGFGNIAILDPWQITVGNFTLNKSPQDPNQA